MKVRARNKLVMGIGINDADYSVNVYDENRKIVWRCKYYACWKGMLERCYDKKCQAKYPSYIGCSVVKEWHLFSNFRAWMQEQDWEGKELDKDLLLYNNKIYGPETCIFISVRVNLFIKERQGEKETLLMGVSYTKSGIKRFKARCYEADTRKQKYLGHFATPEEAHKAWLSFKLTQAYLLAEQQEDSRVAEALINRYENYGVEDK